LQLVPGALSAAEGSGRRRFPFSAVVVFSFESFHFAHRRSG
jgi:hypothetical protein